MGGIFGQLICHLVTDDGYLSLACEYMWYNISHDTNFLRSMILATYSFNCFLS